MRMPEKMKPRAGRPGASENAATLVDGQQQRNPETAPTEATPFNPDRSEFLRFLTLLDESAATFTLQSFTDTAKGEPKPRPDPLAEVRTGTPEALWNWAVEMNRCGAGIFCTVNVTDGRGRRAENIVRIRAVWQEDDGDGKPLPVDAHIVVESSPGKAHRYVLTDALAPAEFAAVMRQMVTNFGSDPSAVDTARVLRIPGLYHLKDRARPHLVRMRQESLAQPYPAAALLAAFDVSPADHVDPVAEPASAFKALTQVGQDVIDELRSALSAISPDERATWIKVGQCLAELGKEGEALWLAWSSRSDKWSPQDAALWTGFKGDRAGYKGIFRMAYDAGWKPPAGSTRFQMSANSPRRRIAFRQVGDVIANPRPVSWLIRGVMEQDCLAQLFGEPGAGKSFLAMDWAACIATGTPWFDKKVFQGMVLYIAGEGLNGMARRFKAWSLARGIDLADAPLHLSTMAASLTDEGGLQEAVEEANNMVAKHGTPALIVIDTVARNFGPGDENSTKDMTAFVAALDALRTTTGATILTVHHSGHHDKERSRGSIALKGALDWEYGLKKEAGVCHLRCTKVKDAEHPLPLALRMGSVDLGYVDEDGEPVTSAVFHPAMYMAPSVAGKEGRGKHQTHAMRVLREGVEACAAYFDKIGDDQTSPFITKQAWREACEQEGMTGKRFAEVYKKLHDLGLIWVEGDRVRVGDGIKRLA